MANSLSVRSFFHASHHSSVHVLNPEQVYFPTTLIKCVLVKVKRYSYAFPLWNKLSAEDCSVNIRIYFFCVKLGHLSPQFQNVRFVYWPSQCQLSLANPQGKLTDWRNKTHYFLYNITGSQNSISCLLWVICSRLQMYEEIVIHRIHIEWN